MSDQPTEPTPQPGPPPPPTTPPPPPTTPPPPVGPPAAPAGYPPTQPAAQSITAPTKPPKPPRPRPAIGLTGPSWVRPVFYYVACLLGILLGAWGALTTAQGVVHLASPDLGQQSDPIGRLASTAVNVIDAGIEAAVDDFEDEFADDAADTAGDVLDSTRGELRSQARKAALDELLRGMILLGIGVAIYRYHWLRVEPEEEPAAPAGTPGPAGP